MMMLLVVVVKYENRIYVSILKHRIIVDRMINDEIVVPSFYVSFVARMKKGQEALIEGEELCNRKKKKNIGQ
jgi:hypothetical protein